MQCIANIGSRDMAEAFGYDIPKLLVSGYVHFGAFTSFFQYYNNLNIYTDYFRVCVI